MGAHDPADDSADPSNFVFQAIGKYTFSDKFRDGRFTGRAEPVTKQVKLGETKPWEHVFLFCLI